MSRLKLLTTIKADGTVTAEVATNDLERLQKTVGGYIQIIPGFTKYNVRRCICYANENGRPDGDRGLAFNKGLPLNSTATSLWQAQLGDGPFWYEPLLYGDIIIEQERKSANEQIRHQRRQSLPAETRRQLNSRPRGYNPGDYRRQNRQFQALQSHYTLLLYQAVN